MTRYPSREGLPTRRGLCATTARLLFEAEQAELNARTHEDLLSARQRVAEAREAIY